MNTPEATALVHTASRSTFAGRPTAAQANRKRKERAKNKTRKQSRRANR